LRYRSRQTAIRDEKAEVESLRSAARAADVAFDSVVLPSQRVIESNGLRLRCLDWGNTGAPTLVFLHGGGLTAHTWDLTCLSLRTTYHCLALDLRGHGDSDWSSEGAYDLEDHVRDVAALVRAVGVSKFGLVGMSIGGNVALAYTASSQHRVVALVLVDIGPDTQPEAAKRIRQFMTGAVPAPLDEFISRALKFNPRRNPQTLRRSLLHNLRQLSNGNYVWKYDPRILANPHADNREDRRTALWLAVAATVCPTLVVRGEDSDVISDEQAASLASRFLRGRWIRVNNAGHTVQGDQPAAFVAALRRFLEEAQFAPVEGMDSRHPDG